MFRTFAPARAGALARALLAAAAALAVGAVAVGGAAACRDVTAPEQDPTTAKYADSLRIDLRQYTRDTSGVYYRDVAVGSGTQAVAGSTVSYYYTGYLADGRRFGTNVGGAVLTAVLGANQAIRGFDRGLLGVRAGGRRYLIIPPALGYGNTSQGTSIPAGSVLIFQVDVPAVTAPTTTTSS